MRAFAIGVGLAAVALLVTAALQGRQEKPQAESLALGRDTATRRSVLPLPQLPQQGLVLGRDWTATFADTAGRMVDRLAGFRVGSGAILLSRDGTTWRLEPKRHRLVSLSGSVTTRIVGFPSVGKEPALPRGCFPVLTVKGRTIATCSALSDLAGALIADRGDERTILVRPSKTTFFMWFEASPDRTLLVGQRLREGSARACDDVTTMVNTKTLEVRELKGHVLGFEPDGTPLLFTAGCSGHGGRVTAVGSGTIAGDLDDAMMWGSAGKQLPG